jgi:hypothetical protein
MKTMNGWRRAISAPWHLLRGAFLGVVEESDAAYSARPDVTNIWQFLRCEVRCYFAPLTGSVKGLRKAWRSIVTPP